MSAALATRAEIVKLTRVLGAEPGELDFLDPVGAEELRRLREQVTDALFDRDNERLRKVGAASKVVPSPIAATIAHRALGPLLCARVAGLVDPVKALDIARRLPDAFLADVAIELDPRRAQDVIARVPARQVGEVAAELVRRQEHVTMGRFVGYVDEQGIRAAMPHIDDAGLLRIAFVMEGKDRLDELISLVPEERLAGLLHTAERERLWPEALDLLDHLSAERRGALAELAVSEGLLEAIVDAAGAQDLWPALLPLVAELPAPARDRVAQLASTLERPLLEHIVAAVNEHDLWSVFVPLAAEHMDAAGRERVAEIVASVDDAVIGGLADAVERGQLWGGLLAIAEQMSAEQLSRVADRLLTAGLEDRLPSLLEAVEQTGLWEIGLRMLAGLDRDLQERLVAPASTLAAGERELVVRKAHELGVLDQLGPIGAALAAK